MEHNTSTNSNLNILEKERNSVDRSIALIKTLEKYGLVTASDDISGMLDEIVLRKEDIKVTHKNISNEVAVALAYLDTEVMQAKNSHVSVVDIIETIPLELISSFITDKYLKSDTEFAKTVIPRIKALLVGSNDQFSDILLRAVEERQKEFINSNIKVIVDGTSGNVLVPSDLH